MRNNYQDCLTRLLKDEGGYTNDPNDSGGPTKFGITLTDYRKYINKKGTAEDVKGMSINDAKSIYKSKYWDVLNCDQLSSGVDYTVFDYGVNSGVGRPRKALQQFKNKTGVDLIDAINDERTAFLKALEVERPKDKKFDKGWMKRIEGVRAYSKVLAKKDNTTGPIVGTITVTLGTIISQYWHNHEMMIIGGSLALAVIVGVAIHLYKNKGK